MKKSLSVLMVLVILLVFSIAGCSEKKSTEAAPEEVKQTTTFMKFATSTMGGTWFPVAAAMSEVINSSIPNVVVTATLGAADANIINIEKGDLPIAFTTSDALAAAAKASRKPFESPVNNVRVLTAVYETPIQIAAPVDSRVSHIKDLPGKRMNAFVIGGSLEVTVRKILEKHGVTYDSIKSAGGTVTHVGYDEQVSMTKDRLLDVSVYMTPAPSQQIVDIETVRPMLLLKAEDTILDALVRENPEYAKTIVKAGTYKGLKEDVATVSVVHLVVVSASLPDDLVYQMTKAIYEKVAAIGAIHPVVKNELKLENAQRGLALPLHPGAKKYYEEMGF